MMKTDKKEAKERSAEGQDFLEGERRLEMFQALGKVLGNPKDLNQ